MSGCCSVPHDEHELFCPACGQKGQRVGEETLRALLRPEALSRVTGGPYRFCRSPDCPVVYFDAQGVVAEKADLRVRVGLKETEDPIPVCYCFGHTEAHLRREIEATGTTTIPERIRAEVKAGHCACEVKNPSGSCCLGDVGRAIKRILRQAQGGILAERRAVAVQSQKAR